MAKEIMTIKDALQAVRAKTKVDKNTGNEKFVYNRFNVERLNTIMRALINDPDFTFETVIISGGIPSPKEIKPTEGLRKFLQNVLIKAGIDKEDSKSVLSSDFKIDDVNGLYEFMAVAMYLFMDNGNKFDMLPTKEFKATFALENVAKKEKTAEKKNPKDGKSLGMWKTTLEQHKKLKLVKSECPVWLKSRKKVG